MDGDGRQPGQNGNNKQDDGAKHHNLSGLAWIMACVVAGNKHRNVKWELSNAPALPQGL
jgi:hypothetical protein